jgi:hypothetical protein
MNELRSQFDRKALRIVPVRKNAAANTVARLQQTDTSAVRAQLNCARKSGNAATDN